MKKKARFIKIEEVYKSIKLKKEIILTTVAVIVVIIFIILTIMDCLEKGNHDLCIRNVLIEPTNGSTIFPTDEPAATSTAEPTDKPTIRPSAESTEKPEETDKPVPQMEAEPISGDLDLLSRLIYAESKDEKSEEHYMLVGNVVMNRAANAEYPDTVREVIYQKGQYSPTWNGQIKYKPDQLAVDCAKRLLAGERFCPENVLFQAEFRQGTGVYKKIGKTYFCYG